MNKKSISSENRFISFVGFVMTAFFLVADHLSKFI